jgi:hypothetical protein
MESPICAAIRSYHLLAFDYDGLPRVVAPYCHGMSQAGEVLRGIQIRGESRTGGFGFGKLWLLERMRRVRVMNETFVPNDPGYNPSDSAMTSIHCFVKKTEAATASASSPISRKRPVGTLR